MINLKDNIDVLEKIIINYIVISDDQEYIIYDENNNEIDKLKLVRLIHPDFFNNETIIKVFRGIKLFLGKYDKLPNLTELEKFLEIKDVEVSSEELKVLFSINLNRYTNSFTYDYIKSFVLIGSLNSSLIKVMSHLKTAEIDPQNIDEIFDFVRTSINDGLDIDFTDASLGLDFEDPEAHIQYQKDKNSTGFRFFDKVLGGGWEPKTLIIIIGRPKSGKSFCLGNIAVRAVLQGLNVGVVSVELSDRKYMKRLGSNLLNIKYEKYNDFYESNKLEPLKQALKEYKKNHPSAGKLKIKEYPTGTVSVFDIENYFIRLESTLNIKFDLIVVDYINILRGYKDSQTMYERVKKISEQLRAIAVRNKWCVITAAQVKVSYFNTEELRIDSPAESSGMVATVDSMFGLVPLNNRRIIKIINLANRDEGNMESYKKFRIVREYFRMIEENSSDSEYYSDEDGEELEEELKKEYSQMSKTNGNKLTEVSHKDILESMERNFEENN